MSRASQESAVNVLDRLTNVELAPVHIAEHVRLRQHPNKLAHRNLAVFQLNFRHLLALAVEHIATKHLQVSCPNHRLGGTFGKFDTGSIAVAATTPRAVFLEAT